MRIRAHTRLRLHGCVLQLCVKRRNGKHNQQNMHPNTIAFLKEGMRRKAREPKREQTERGMEKKRTKGKLERERENV